MASFSKRFAVFAVGVGTLFVLLASVAWYSTTKDIQELRNASTAANQQLQTLFSTDETSFASSLTRSQLQDGIYVTIELDDGTVAYARIEEGTVESEKLKDEVSLVFSDAQPMTFTLGEDSVLNVHLADGSVQQGTILDAAVTSTKLADGSVTELKIRDGAITGGKLQDGTITALDFEEGAVVSAAIADGVVTSSKLAVNSVTTASLRLSSVTSGEIADGAVSTLDLADLSVTAAKIAAGTITGSQIASDGSVVKALSGSSVVEVTDNGNGTYSLALEASCSDGQLLAWSDIEGTWSCGDPVALTNTFDDIVLTPTNTAEATEGRMYYDSITDKAYVYNGSVFVDMTAAGDLVASNNLSDLDDASTARTNLGLGTAATLDTGTSVGDAIVIEDVGGGTAGLPAIDGSQLTGIAGGGGGGGEYAFATLSVNQSSNISAGNHVEFDTVSGDIALSTGAGQSDGQFTLSAGSTYKLEAALSGRVTNASGGYVNFRWYDVTAGEYIDPGVKGQLIMPAYDSAFSRHTLSANALISPNVETVVELRFEGVSNPDFLTTTGTHAFIQEL